MILFEKKNKHGEFQDILGQSIDTGDKWLDKKLNANICYGKGGGGSQQQDVPKTLRPYVTQVLDRAKGLYGSYVPQQLYQGERIVGFTPAEQAAQAGLAGMVGRGISASPELTSGATYYQPALGLLGESGELGRQAAQDITAEEIMGRMSPYQQAVTDIAKRKATIEGQQYLTELGGQATRTGGFGGSRQAILEGMAASDLGQRLTDIQTTGSQAAYQDAIRAAEAQRARLIGGAQQAGALSQAFGALGQQALGQGYREQGYLSGLGEQERGLQQQRADLAYQQFTEQRDYPDVQLQKYSSLIQGFPFNFAQAPAPSPTGFQQLAGGAAGVASLGKTLGFFNKGGKINGDREDNLDGTVYRQAGGLAGIPLNYDIEEIKKYLAGTRFDREAKEEELAEQRRAAEATALAQVAQGILGADPRRGGVAALVEGATKAQPSLQQIAAIKAKGKGIGAEERKANIEDYLTVKQLEELEAKRQKAAAEAAEAGVVDPEDPKYGKRVDEMVDSKLNFTVGEDPISGNKIVMLGGKTLDSKTASELFNFRARALEIGQQFRQTHPKSWSEKTAEWIAKNEPKFTGTP
jgi:hypothetical protein